MILCIAVVVYIRIFIKEMLIWRVGIEKERARLILAFMIGEEGKYNTFTSF
jgi:hypothetical protein